MEKRNIKNNVFKNTLENKDRKKLTLRKNTIKAIEHRRNSLFGSSAGSTEESLEKKKVNIFFLKIFFFRIIQLLHPMIFNLNVV